MGALKTRDWKTWDHEIFHNTLTHQRKTVIIRLATYTHDVPVFCSPAYSSPAFLVPTKVIPTNQDNQTVNLTRVPHPDTRGAQTQVLKHFALAHKMIQTKTLADLATYALPRACRLP